MANLNFQQPPRSIANASLTGRTTGGFGGSSLSGHVTPTSGMFPTGNTSYGQTQQPQLSPNRNAQLSVGGPAQLSSGRPNMFGQRPFVERRGMQSGLSGTGGGPMSNMGNFMQAARSGTGGYGAGGMGGGLGGLGGVGGVTGGSINNFHNAFSSGGGGGGDANPLLDPSEFPSLSTVRGQNDSSLPQTNPLQPPGSKPYVGMVKQPTSEQSEFTMSNEDFPALPGTTQNADGTTTTTAATTPTTNNASGMPVENNLIDGATMEKTLNALAAASNNSNSVIGGVGGSTSSNNNNNNHANSGLGAVGSSVSMSGGSSIGGMQHLTSSNSNNSGSNSSCTVLNNSLGIVGSSNVGIVGSGSTNAIGSGSGSNSANSNINMINMTGGSQQIMQNLISGNNSILGGMTVGGNNNSSNNNNPTTSSSGNSNNNNNNINNSVSILSTPGNGNNSLNSNNSNSLTLNTISNSSSGTNNNNTNSSNNNNNNNNNIGGNAMVMNAIGAITSKNNNNNNNNSSSTNSSSNNIDYASNENNSSNDKLVRVGVQTHPDGKVTNIPTSMVNNQFGMVGLLTFIRASETDQNLVTLALGTDLTGLGLNLNSQESLHPTFAGPFADHPCRAQDVEYNVPHEYSINHGIRDKLATPVLKKLAEDLLFYLFYTNIGDIMQLMAAAELYSRDWRYHIEEKIWITRIPGINQYEKNGTKERGTFCYFDAQSWKRLNKVFQVDAEKLDKCPNISSFGQSV